MSIEQQFAKWEWGQLLDEMLRYKAALGYFLAMEDENTWLYGRNEAENLARKVWETARHADK